MKEMLERYIAHLDELIAQLEEYERYLGKIAARCQNGGQSDENKRISVP